MKAIQDTIIPHAEQWSHRSSTTFKADKTSLIHFMHQLILDDPPNLCFSDTEITPSQSIKVLGVILDTGLKIDEHILKAIAKGFKACLSLQAIKGV
jgi:hypothetical protein